MDLCRESADQVRCPDPSRPVIEAKTVKVEARDGPTQSDAAVLRGRLTESDVHLFVQRHVGHEGLRFLV